MNTLINILLMISINPLLPFNFIGKGVNDNISESCFLEKKGIQKGDMCVLTDVAYYPFSSEMDDRVRTYCDSVVSFLAEHDLQMSIEIGVFQACEAELSRTWIGARAEKIREYVESKGLDNISFEAKGYRYGIPAEEFSTFNWEEIKSYSKIRFNIIDVWE